MKIKEVRVRVPLSFSSFKVVVTKFVQPNNQQEQQINTPVNHNEAIIDEPAVNVLQEVALIKSQRQKRYSIFDDNLVYLHELEIDLGIDNDLVSLLEATESNKID